MPSNDALVRPASMPDAIERYFEVALYLLVLTGFGTLASTGGLAAVPVLLVGFALLLRGYLLATRQTFVIPERWTTFLTLSYVAFYLLDYMVLAHGFLNATVHLVLFVMVVRLFSAQRDRDRYFLAVIAFLMVLAASVLTVDSTFLLAFALFLLTAVATFILMEMRRSARDASIRTAPHDEHRAYRKMALSLAGIAPILVILISLGAAAIFFVLPRSSSGYLSAYAPGGDIATGFSDEVRLGRIGQIQQSSALVMHIQIDGDAGGAYDLKWRGVSLNIFDGKTWSNPHEQHFMPHPLDGRFVLSMITRASRSGADVPARTVHYRVLMEPVASNVFFLAPSPLTLEGNYRLIATDAGGAVFNLDPDHPVTTYQADSNIAEPSPDALRLTSNNYPPEVLLNNLQLPPLDPRVNQLAEQIAASQATNYDKAAAIERYLRTHYAYTLQLSDSPPHDPIGNFLFERKAGHCEYFASSMAVMLRTLRIPTRVVNGFRTGEFNDLTGQYLVRASNAHAWVEVYFPGYGWVDFDPTPAGSFTTHSGWGRAMLYLDAAASFWREWVINYDSGHQYTLGRQLARNSFEWYERMRFWALRHYEAALSAARRTQRTVTSAPTSWSIAGILLSLLLLIAANLGRLWRLLRTRRIAAHPEQAPRLAATIWYERMTRGLAKRGWPKSPVQTPSEFARSLPQQPVQKNVLHFTAEYERARFGDSPDAARQLPELFDEIFSAGR